MAYPPPPHRPLGVAILAILVILAGLALTILMLLAVVAALAAMSLGIPGSGLLLAIFGVGLILSLILLAAGIGLWRMSRLAWFLAILVTGLVFISQLGGWFAAGQPTNAGSLLAVGLPLIILIYLLAVGKYFGRQAYYPR